MIAAENTLTPQSFYYVGGNVGGPIFFPHFNHNSDKLFFWAGYEYMIQHPYNAPVEMNVPTARVSHDQGCDGPGRWRLPQHWCEP